ncbi:MAG: alanine racemase, partial [Chloroflexota bacterium]|nr:alanine racemase [Chloroflexota bacterium]
WLEIDTDALAANLRLVRALAAPAARVAAVVKADAYGHGIEIAGRTFIAAGADVLCVATLDEALLLRSAGIRAPVAVLFAVSPARVRDAVEAGIELIAAEMDVLRETLAAWKAQRREGVDELSLHLEVETGLMRAGIRPERVAEAAQLVAETPRATIAGLWSHLASSHDAVASAEQVRRFDAASSAVRAVGIDIRWRHLAATGALFAGTAPHYEMVRPGLALYGELPEGFPVSETASPAARGLRPALTLKARPLRIEAVAAGTAVGYGGLWRAERASLVATLPIGYGDGWDRTYGGRAAALVRGRRVALVGSVAMDAVAADVTDVPGVGPGDEFVFLGAQRGERIRASELARLRNTISWEVLSSMAQRVTRVYHAGAGLMGVRTLVGESLAR